MCDIQTEEKTGGTLDPMAKNNLLKATRRGKERSKVLYLRNGSPSAISKRGYRKGWISIVFQ